MALHIPEGNVALKQALMADPYNLLATYIGDYDDCLTLLINADRSVFDKCKGHMDYRLSLLNNGSEASPWYRLCKAGIYLHWALVNVRFGEHFKAATLFRKSYLLLKENEEKFPHFDYNKVFLGLEETVVGTIPDNYKWVASVLGLHGSVRKGIEDISSFLNAHHTNDPLYTEAVVYQAYLKFYLQSKQKEVWDFLSSNEYVTADNLLYTFVKANIAVNYRKADVAIQTMRQEDINKDYLRYPVFDYEMGNALLSRLDPVAISYFQRYLKNNRSRIYIKDTWQKMAYVYYLQGNTREAEYCRTQINTQGSTQVDADKQAQRFYEKQEWPPTGLLKAHLLIDGGYHKQALEALSIIKETSLSKLSDKLEYNFRMARAYDEGGDVTKALAYYQRTINMGKNEAEYYAARSALQIGFIYEHSGNTKEALARYRECLSMRGHDFQSSLDQQAKAGVNRLGK